MKHTYHIVPNGSEWTVRSEAGNDLGITGSNKANVMERTIAKAKEQGESSVIIHSADGRIQEERTYPRSADPRKTKG